MTRRRTPPEDVQKFAGSARRHLPCHDCSAAPGDPYTRPGSGRTVHKARYIAAAIEVSQQARAARRTPGHQAELDAILAGLPRVSRAEIEACRTPAGGYSFTRERLARWGMPWPASAGWLDDTENEEVPPGATERNDHDAHHDHDLLQPVRPHARGRGQRRR